MMKMKRFKMISCLCLLLSGAIVVSVGFAVQMADASFGQALTTEQMSNMYGGAWVCSGDMDCDTVSTDQCPGGDTCKGSNDSGSCRDCKSGYGDICGTPGGAGYQCVNGTETCNKAVGGCNQNTCETAGGYTVPGNPLQDDDQCGSRSNCD